MKGNTVNKNEKKINKRKTKRDWKVSSLTVGMERKRRRMNAVICHMGEIKAKQKVGCEMQYRKKSHEL